MFKHKINLLVALSIAAVAIVICCVWIYRSSSARKASPVTVSINVSKLPVSCEVLGSKVTLRALAQDNKLDYLQLRVYPGSTPIVLDKGYVVFDDKRFDDVETPYYFPANGCRINVPRKTRRLEIGHGFHLKSKSKTVFMSLPHVNVDRLPVEKCFGSTVITLRSLRIGHLDHSRNPALLRKHFAVLEFDLFQPRNPDTNWRRTVCWERDFEPTVSFGSGPMLRPYTWWANNIDSATDVFRKESETVTLSERLVSYFSNRAAYKMLIRRATKAALKEKAFWRIWLAFPTNGKLPRQISFRGKAQLPPDPNEQAFVTFKNVPVP